MADSKLAYLEWKSQWWQREFERLHRTTGLQLNFDGEDENGSPVQELMIKFQKKEVTSAFVSPYRTLPPPTAQSAQSRPTLPRFTVSPCPITSPCHIESFLLLISRLPPHHHLPRIPIRWSATRSLTISRLQTM